MTGLAGGAPGTADGARRAGPPARPPGDPSLLLPDGTRLVHIGPHKTGTTSLQGAFHAARAAIAARGVHYAGRTSQPMEAVHAATGRPWFRTPSPRAWRSLVAEIRGSRAARVVVSSEAFADADPAAIRRIVDDLGPERLHVAVTVRPLARLLPSQWQQDVQQGVRIGFDHWLEILFDGPPDPPPAFWRLHRHDRLVDQWAAVVGPANVTVVVADDRDHDFVLRAFEGLTGLPPGTLVASPVSANRSLTLPEAEVVRAFNVASHGAGLERARLQPARRQAVLHLAGRVPAADEPRIELPPWAVERVAATAREVVAGLAGAGVRVVGDLEPLALVAPTGRSDDRPVDPAITPEIVARFALGILLATGGGGAGAAALRRLVVAEPIEVARIPSRELAAIAGRRLRDAAAARLHR